ncbi:RNA polymerase sigma factor SigZ [Flagellimonas pacifica]|uniref:RNA polymerase sigma factor SigZ n=1 Tax=Flagellimonas pacifica TaxID=1247520 RepID=A0A285MUB9_9FLAO|nr:RNA polymerase sigma factor SigZ [Allomuricauda parva]SNZ00147.1 RNA polymerase, sigma subunit, SigZ [Allomuricauda parva]
MNADIGEVWNDMNDRLTNFVIGKVNDSELTKDIVQDVFLKVFSKNDTLKQKDKLISWIYQITRNEIINHFRNVDFYNPSIVIEEEEFNENKLTSELAECVRPVINSLPQKYKEALILSDIENIPQKEIAERLNISYSGLKSRVQRGRAMLKSTCEQCCDISTDVYGDILDYNPKKIYEK